MPRRLFTLVAVLSLLLFAAAIAFWVRGIWVPFEEIGWTNDYHEEQPRFDWIRWSIARHGAHVLFERVVTLGDCRTENRWQGVYDLRETPYPDVDFSFLPNEISWSRFGIALAKSVSSELPPALVVDFDTGQPTPAKTSAVAVRVPYWVVLLLSGILPLFWAISSVLRRRDPRAGRCTKCGYSLVGNTSGTCPECGAPTIPRGSEGNG